MAISHCYLHVYWTQNGNWEIYSNWYLFDSRSTALCWGLTSSVQEFQFYIVTDMSSGPEWQFLTWLLTSSGQEWPLNIATDIYVVVKIGNVSLLLTSSRSSNGNFTLQLTSSGPRMAISQCYWHSSGQEWPLNIATGILEWRMAMSHCYWHLQVKNGNFTLQLTSSGLEWKFHTTNDTHRSRMKILHCYWHLLVKNANFRLLLTSTGHEWQFHTTTDI